MPWLAEHLHLRSAVNGNHQPANPSPPSPTTAPCPKTSAGGLRWCKTNRMECGRSLRDEPWLEDAGAPVVEMCATTPVFGQASEAAFHRRSRRSDDKSHPSPLPLRKARRLPLLFAPQPILDGRPVPRGTRLLAEMSDTRRQRGGQHALPHRLTKYFIEQFRDEAALLILLKIWMPRAKLDTRASGSGDGEPRTNTNGQAATSNASSARSPAFARRRIDLQIG
jgi:hypothetical protein